VEGEQREGEKQTQADVALFFVTYVLINSVMMLNVVVAVLLDEFLGSVARDKEERERLEQAEKEKLKVTGCLDELTLQLINFIDDEDLGAKIASIYHQLDADASGGLSFDEFKAAVKGLVGHVHLTRDDFDELSNKGKLLGQHNDFNVAQFQEMMRLELWRYTRRELNNVLAVSQDSSFRSIVLMLKMLEGTLFEVRASTAETASRMQALERNLGRKADGGGGGDGGQEAAGVQQQEAKLRVLEEMMAQQRQETKFILEHLQILTAGHVLVGRGTAVPQASPRTRETTTQEEQAPVVDAALGFGSGISDEFGQIEHLHGGIAKVDQTLFGDSFGSVVSRNGSTWDVPPHDDHTPVPPPRKTSM